MKYDKIILTNLTTVAGNIRDFKQQYEIKFYPKADDLPAKIALYIYLTKEEKQFAKRSVYFSSAEQLKRLILDLTEAYFYFKDKKIIKLPIPMPIEELRKDDLNDFLIKLKLNQLNIWKENVKNKRNSTTNNR